MARNNLNRHEQLRYDYLLKNLQYLNDREKQEFDFLYEKKMHGFQYSNHYSDTDSSSYGEDDFYEDYAEPEEAYTSQGLPKYPSERRSKRSNNYQTVESDPYSSDYQESDDFFEYDNDDYDEGYSHYATYRGDDSVQTQGNPIKKLKKIRPKFKIKQILLALGIFLLLILSGMGYMFYKGYKDVASGSTDYTAAVTETFNGEDTADGTNILILGSDQRITQGSSDARTDTIMVANIGNSDGTVKLVSFMRDTLVNIDGVSASDYSYDQKLNVAFNIGEQDNNQGAELMREVLKDNFDIDIKYYVMIDFETFAEAIDTLFPNGVEIDAQFGTVDGVDVSSVDVPDDLNMAADGTVPEQTIEEGTQQMDGRTLLNYARFRKDDDGDYGRTQRQQQVIAAVISQIKDPTKLFTGSAAIGKVYALTSTNVSYAFLLKQGVSIITSGQEGIEQKTIPEEGDWEDTYDMYGGLGLSIDFDKYQKELAELGLR